MTLWNIVRAFYDRISRIICIQIWLCVTGIYESAATIKLLLFILIINYIHFVNLMYLYLKLLTKMKMCIVGRALCAFPQKMLKQVFGSMIANWIVFRFKYGIVNCFGKWTLRTCTFTNVHILKRVVAKARSVQ